MLITTRRSLRRIGARLGRWPRRIACLVCLLLAAGSALSPRAAPSSAASGREAGPVDVLHAGEVAVPVSVDFGGTATAVRPGDHVGVLAGSSADGFAARPAPAVLVADHLRVLTVENTDGGIGGEATVNVVLATSRSGALRLARFSGRRLLLIADQFP